MARGIVVGALLTALVVAGCGMEPDDGEEPTTGQAPDRTLDEVKSMLVGTWDYGLRFSSGDVVPTVRVIEADGTGHQYAKDAGVIGKQSFTWTLSDDGAVLTLAYGEMMKVVYDIARIEDGKVDLEPRSPNAFTEECVRR